MRAEELAQDLVRDVAADCKVKVVVLNSNWLVEERVQVVDESVIN